MLGRAAVGVAAAGDGAAGDDDHLARFEGDDLVLVEPQVEERHALTRRGEDGAVGGVAEGPQAERVAEDDHLAEGVQEDEVERAVELGRHRLEHVEQVGLLGLLEFAAEQVEDDFGVVVPRQVVVGVGEQFGFEFFEIGEVAVEGEGEPLPLAPVRTCSNGWA